MTAPVVAEANAAQSERSETMGKSGVERRDNLSYGEFAANYIKPRRPVILTGLTRGWAAMERWTPRYFAERWGDMKVQLCAGRRVYRAPFRWFVDYLQRHSLPSSAADAKELLYLRNVILYQTMPELEHDFEIPEIFLPDWFELWPMGRIFPLAGGAAPQLFIGPPGAGVPVIHRDTMMTHAWLTQIHGSKRIWLVSPREDHLIYQDERDLNHSMVDSLKDPDMEAFPLMRNATVLSDILHPGETLFLPCGWWHTAECLSVSIGISGNFVNRSNFRDFISEFNRVPDDCRNAEHRKKEIALRLIGATFAALFPLGRMSMLGGAYEYFRRKSLQARANERAAG